jgi:hypothetical protein
MTPRLRSFVPARSGGRAALVVLALVVSVPLASCGELEPISFTRRPSTTIEGGIVGGIDPDLLPETTLPSMRPARYTVQPGDSIGGIATRFGLTIDSLLAANNMDDPNRLEAGTVLNIPGPNATTPPPWLQRENRDSTRGR